MKMGNALDAPAASVARLRAPQMPMSSAGSQGQVTGKHLGPPAPRMAGQGATMAVGEVYPGHPEDSSMVLGRVGELGWKGKELGESQAVQVLGEWSQPSGERGNCSQPLCPWEGRRRDTIKQMLTQVASGEEDIGGWES